MPYGLQLQILAMVCSHFPILLVIVIIACVSFLLFSTHILFWLVYVQVFIGCYWRNFNVLIWYPFFSVTCVARCLRALFDEKSTVIQRRIEITVYHYIFVFIAPILLSVLPFITGMEVPSNLLFLWLIFIFVFFR